jgi:hypothetical protein
MFIHGRYRVNLPCISFSAFLNVKSRNFILWRDWRVGCSLCVCGGGGEEGEFVVLLLRYKILLCKSAACSMNKVDTVKCSSHTTLELNSFRRNFLNVCRKINKYFFVFELLPTICMVSKYSVARGIFCSYDEYRIQFPLSHTIQSPTVVLYFPLLSHVFTFSDDILSDLQ